ncbi:MAG: hypothetical protein KJO78_14575 [Alphaproteobacteria bacterium]|jgi:hypothetical protein|nr:hypothetical protein [Alphaproteobacteria bacterium]
MRKLITVLTIVVTMTPLAGQAQQFCAERAKITDRLKTGYGERYSGGGLRNAESIFEVWMSEEKGTWTILMTMADGRSCVMASGTNWRNALPEQPAGVPG